MCEFTDAVHKRAALQYFSAFPERLFNNPILLERFPFAFQQGKCPVCGAFLESHERRPQGRATRSMCSYDYQNLIANMVNDSCLICVGPLAESKVQNQYRQPREVAHHLHDGECTNLWTLIHNVSVSEPEIVARLAEPTRPSGYLPPPATGARMPFLVNHLLGTREAVPAEMIYRGKIIRRIE